MPGAQRAATVVLSVLYLVSGGLCLAGAARPLAPETPVGLLATLGGVGLLGGGALLAVRRRGWAWPIHAGLLLLAVCVGLLAHLSATTLGIVGLGPNLICFGLYAAHFLPTTSARAHVVLVLALATAGATTGHVALPWQPWLVAVVSTVLVTEVQGRLTLALRRAASQDALTGLLNRRAWLASTERAVQRATRQGGPVTVALIDLDDFKAVNDSDGHAAGDTLLRELASAWSGVVRGSDALARYGGDEFALQLDTDRSTALLLLERMAGAHHARWSAGLAEWVPGDTPDTLLHRADVDLYAHKQDRRGRAAIPA